MIKGFSEWSVFDSMNENVQEAKKIIKKHYADKVFRKPLGEMNDSEINQALSDRNYKSILNLTKKNPGYSGPFVKFAFEQNVPISATGGEEIRSLKQLINWINGRKQIISRLPRRIEDYANSREIEGVSGFEKLADDIRTIERRISLKWIVDSLPIKPREEYRKLPDDKKEEFLNIANFLEELDKDDSQKTITTRLLSKIKAMQNDSIEDIISYMSNFIQGYSDINVKKTINDVINLEPEAGILYNKHPYLAISIRTKDAQKKLCSIANWCINRGSFDSYTSDAIQINIFNYSLLPQDPMFLTGTTVSYSGQVTHSHDLNDRNLFELRDPKQHFMNIGLAEDIANGVVEKIPEEIEIKKIVTNLFNLSKRKSLPFIVRLINITEEKTRGNFSDEEWANIINVILQILEKSGESLHQQIINFLEENGVFTIPGVILLKEVLLKKLSINNINKIYRSTEEVFDEIDRLYDYQTKIGGSDIQELKKILANKEEILSEIKEIS
jgi:hypothetical protein